MRNKRKKVDPQTSTSRDHVIDSKGNLNINTSDLPINYSDSSRSNLVIWRQNSTTFVYLGNKKQMRATMGRGRDLVYKVFL